VKNQIAAIGKKPKSNVEFNNARFSGNYKKKDFQKTKEPPKSRAKSITKMKTIKEVSELEDKPDSKIL
jgi:hypothetical protein